MKISINCPSYKRPKVQTLAYLPMCKVWVSEDEYDNYIKANPGFEANIIKCPREKQGNVSRIRNWILENELENNDVTILVDDDMSEMVAFELRNDYAYTKETIKTEDFYDFVEKYSIMASDLGFKMWGVNVNGDAMTYRQYSPFSTVSIILGPFCAFLKGSQPRYDTRLLLKEDYDMFIQQANLYRGVLRVNHIFYLVKQSTNVGGCASVRNYDKERSQLILLRKKWGSDIVKVDRTNKGRSKKEKKLLDYNPIIKIPINGI